MPKKKSAKSAKPAQAFSLGTLAQLPKGPQTSADRIEELASRILTGDILLPKFQRGFVWDRNQILALLESVAKGYPIGSILLWQSNSDLKSERKIADLNVELQRPGYPVNYLLDGQQRLSVICGALYWHDDVNPDSQWNIAYDLRTQSFLHLHTLEEPPTYQVRTNKLADNIRFAKHLASLELMPEEEREDLKRRAEDLLNRFKDYKIATVTMGDMSVTDVAPIFERINSKGTPLTIVDLMRAATWKPDFDLIDSIDEILEDVSDKGFDTIDRLVILRNISAAAGGGFHSGSISNLRNSSVTQLGNAVDDVSEALKICVDFLTTQIGVTGAEVVPYANQVTVLTEAFRRLTQPTIGQYLALAEWFWRTAVADYFRGWNTGSMVSDLEAVKDFADGRTDGLVVHATKPDPSIWQYRTFGLGNALSKLFAIALSQRQPIDLLSGQKIDTAKALAWSNTKEYHHVFPRQYLKQKGEKPDRINCLANHIMLTSASNKKISAAAPSIYLRRVIEQAGPNLGQVLESNLISQDAFQAALADNFDLFIDLRSYSIHGFVLDKANWI